MPSPRTRQNMISFVNQMTTIMEAKTSLDGEEGQQLAREFENPGFQDILSETRTEASFIKSLSNNVSKFSEENQQNLQSTFGLPLVQNCGKPNNSNLSTEESDESVHSCSTSAGTASNSAGNNDSPRDEYISSKKSSRQSESACSHTSSSEAATQVAVIKKADLTTLTDDKLDSAEIGAVIDLAANSSKEQMSSFLSMVMRSVKRGDALPKFFQNGDVKTLDLDVAMRFTSGMLNAVSRDLYDWFSTEYKEAWCERAVRLREVQRLARLNIERAVRVRPELKGAKPAKIMEAMTNSSNIELRTLVDRHCIVNGVKAVASTITRDDCQCIYREFAIIPDDFSKLQPSLVSSDRLQVLARILDVVSSPAFCALVQLLASIGENGGDHGDVKAGSKEKLLLAYDGFLFALAVNIDHVQQLVNAFAAADPSLANSAPVKAGLNQLAAIQDQAIALKTHYFFRSGEGDYMATWLLKQRKQINERFVQRGAQKIENTMKKNATCNGLVSEVDMILSDSGLSGVEIPGQQLNRKNHGKRIVLALESGEEAALESVTSPNDETLEQELFKVPGWKSLYHPMLRSELVSLFSGSSTSNYADTFNYILGTSTVAQPAEPAANDSEEEVFLPSAISTESLRLLLKKLGMSTCTVFQHLVKRTSFDERECALQKKKFGNGTTPAEDFEELIGKWPIPLPFVRSPHGAHRFGEFELSISYKDDNSKAISSLNDLGIDTSAWGLESLGKDSSEKSDSEILISFVDPTKSNTFRELSAIEFLCEHAERATNDSANLSKFLQTGKVPWSVSDASPPGVDGTALNLTSLTESSSSKIGDKVNTKNSLTLESLGSTTSTPNQFEEFQETLQSLTSAQSGSDFSIGCPPTRMWSAASNLSSEDPNTNMKIQPPPASTGPRHFPDPTQFLVNPRDFGKGDPYYKGRSDWRSDWRKGAGWKGAYGKGKGGIKGSKFGGPVNEVPPRYGAVPTNGETVRYDKYGFRIHPNDRERLETIGANIDFTNIDFDRIDFDKIRDSFDSSAPVSRSASASLESATPLTQRKRSTEWETPPGPGGGGTETPATKRQCRGDWSRGAMQGPRRPGNFGPSWGTGNSHHAYGNGSETENRFFDEPYTPATQQREESSLFVGKSSLAQSVVCSGPPLNSAGYANRPASTMTIRANTKGNNNYFGANSEYNRFMGSTGPGKGTVSGYPNMDFNSSGHVAGPPQHSESGGFGGLDDLANAMDKLEKLGSNANMPAPAAAGVTTVSSLPNPIAAPAANKSSSELAAWLGLGGVQSEQPSLPASSVAAGNVAGFQSRTISNAPPAQSWLDELFNGPPVTQQKSADNHTFASLNVPSFSNQINTHTNSLASTAPESDPLMAFLGTQSSRVDFGEI